MIQITAVAVAAARVQNANRWIFNSAVVGFAVIGFHTHVVWIDFAEKNMRADFE